MCYSANITDRDVCIMSLYDHGIHCPAVYMALFTGTCSVRFIVLVIPPVDANKGDDRCYSFYNTRGDEFGNCGYTQTAFIPCDAR